MKNTNKLRLSTYAVANRFHYVFLKRICNFSCCFHYIVCFVSNSMMEEVTPNVENRYIYRRYFRINFCYSICCDLIKIEILIYRYIYVFNFFIILKIINKFNHRFIALSFKKTPLENILVGPHFFGGLCKAAVEAFICKCFFLIVFNFQIFLVFCNLLANAEIGRGTADEAEDASYQRLIVLNEIRHRRAEAPAGLMADADEEGDGEHRGCGGPDIYHALNPASGSRLRQAAGAA